MSTLSRKKNHAWNLLLFFSNFEFCLKKIIFTITTGIDQIYEKLRDFAKVKYSNCNKLYSNAVSYNFFDQIENHSSISNCWALTVSLRVYSHSSEFEAPQNSENSGLSFFPIYFLLGLQLFRQIFYWRFWPYIGQFFPVNEN